MQNKSFYAPIKRGRGAALGGNAARATRGSATHPAYGKTPRSTHPKARALLCGVALLCLVLLVERQIRPILRAVIEYESRRYAITAFNEAITAHLALNPTVYQSLYTVTFDDDSVPTAVVGDSYQINLARSELAQQVYKSLIESNQKIYSFHLGRLSGVQMLASVGPIITLEMKPESYIITHIYNTLEEAGNNQTLLSVYVQITVQINVSMAGYLQSVTVENEVLLWQNLLIGRVPDVNV